MSEKRQLIVYNSNNPKELFTCLQLKKDDLGIYVVTGDHYSIIEATCEGGPYLSFFRDTPEIFYTFFKAANPLDAIGDDAWYNLHQTCLRYDEKQRDIVSTILRKICEMELRAQAEEKKEKRKHAPDKGDSEKNK